jgi:hypothetical protein
MVRAGLPFPLFGGADVLKEFKAFIMRGNVLDLAVGFIMGGAFGTIVKSLVDDVIMPPIGVALGNVDFSSLMVTLKEGAKAPGPYHSLRQQHRELPHRRIRRVPAGAGGQPAQPGRGGRGPEHEGLPLLPHGDPHRGDPVPAMHVGAALASRLPGPRGA